MENGAPKSDERWLYQALLYFLSLPTNLCIVSLVYREWFVWPVKYNRYKKVT